LALYLADGMNSVQSHTLRPEFALFALAFA